MLLTPHLSKIQDVQRLHATMSLLPYKYSLLSRDNYTRMIELQPATNAITDPLHCTIKEVEMTSDLSYSAISYTWGEPSFTEELIIDQMY